MYDFSVVSIHLTSTDCILTLKQRSPTVKNKDFYLYSTGPFLKTLSFN